MAELTDLQRELLQAQQNQKAMLAVGQDEPALVDRPAPGYAQPQTIEEFNRAMPASKPRAIKLDANLEQAFAKAAAKAAAKQKVETTEQATWESGGGTLGMLGEAARATLEGVATMPDWPAMAGTGLGNIYNRVAEKPLVDPPMYANTAFNKLAPPNPSFPEVRSWFNTAGPILVTGPLGAAEATLPGLAARTAVTTGGVKLGEKVGGDVGEHFFGEPGKTYGSILGSAALGGVTQPLTQHFGYNVANRMLADRGGEFIPGSSANKLAALQRLGGGDHASLGLLGNRFARLLEDIIGNIPGAGGPINTLRRNLYTFFGDTAHETAGMMDPSGIPPVGEISKGGLGLRSNRVAEVADDSITRGLNNLYDENSRYGLHARTDPATGQVILPRATPSLPARQRQVLDDLTNSPLIDQASQGPTIRSRVEALEESSNLIHDQAYEQQLDARGRAVDAAEAQLRNDPTIDPANRAVFEQQLVDRRAQIEQERALNRAPSFQAERTARQNDARRPDGLPNDRAILRDTRVARDEDMRQTAADASGNDPEFMDFYDNVDNWASQLLGQRVSIKGLLSDRKGNAAKPGTLHTRMFGDSGITDIEQMRTLIEHAPGPLRELLARQYEKMMRGPDAGSPVSNPEAFVPQDAVTWWDKQNDPVMQEAYGPNRRVQQRQADLQTVLRAETARPKRSVPGKGGNTLGSPGVMTGLLGALLSGVAAKVAGSGAVATLGSPLIAAGLGIPLAMRFIGNRMTNPGFTQRVIHPPTLGDIASQPNLSRILSSAVAGGVDESKRKKRPNQGKR